MREAGQFVVDPRTFLGWLDGRGIAGVGVMLILLAIVRALLLRRLYPPLAVKPFMLGIAVGGLTSISSTLMMTGCAFVIAQPVIAYMGVGVIEDRLRDAGITVASLTPRNPYLNSKEWGGLVDEAAVASRAVSVVTDANGEQLTVNPPIVLPGRYKPVRPPLLVPRQPSLDQPPGYRGPIISTQSIQPPGLAVSLQPEVQQQPPQDREQAVERSSQLAGKEKISRGISNHSGQVPHQLNRMLMHQRSPGGRLLLIVLLVVGAGYACTFVPLGFWGSFTAMSCGVGLPEELCKLLAGLMLLGWMCDSRSMSAVSFRRAVVVMSGVAGLGFGAVEALKYFGVYAAGGLGWEVYLVRAGWCVSLHGAWTMIAGYTLACMMPQDANLFWQWGDKWVAKVTLACVPTAVLHGLYNTLCYEESRWMWAVGSISLIAAVVICEVARMGAGIDRVSSPAIV